MCLLNKQQTQESQICYKVFIKIDRDKYILYMGPFASSLNDYYRLNTICYSNNENYGFHAFRDYKYAKKLQQEIEEDYRRNKDYRYWYLKDTYGKDFSIVICEVNFDDCIYEGKFNFYDDSAVAIEARQMKILKEI